MYTKRDTLRASNNRKGTLDATFFRGTLTTKSRVFKQLLLASGPRITTQKGTVGKRVPRSAYLFFDGVEPQASFLEARFSGVRGLLAGFHYFRVLTTCRNSLLAIFPGMSCSLHNNPVCPLHERDKDRWTPEFCSPVIQICFRDPTGPGTGASRKDRDISCRNFFTRFA